MAGDLNVGPCDATEPFTSRVAALRTARDCAPEDALSTLDAALVELGRVEEELHQHGSKAADRGEPAESPPRSSHRRDLQTLRNVFQQQPVPALVLSHTGVIRRANRLAVELLGTSPAHITGRSLLAFVEPAARAAFESQLAGALHATGPTHFDTRMQCGNGSAGVRVSLSATEVADGKLVVCVIVTSPPVRWQDCPPVSDSDPGEETVIAAARRLDIMSRMTRLLLDEESLSEPVALQRAAQTLASEFADWVLIDVVIGGQVKRAVVCGSDASTDLGVRVLEELDPRQSGLLRDVLDTGSPVVHSVIEDINALGVTHGGAPVLATLRAGSLLSVALCDERGTLGALTLVRRNNRRRLELSDLGLFEEIADHLALALRTERRYQRRSDAADALQSSLLPRALPAVSGLEVGVGYHAATAGVEVGGDFYDVFEGQRGWGLVLGDVCGKGEEAAAVTAMVRHSIRMLGVWQTDPRALLQQVSDAMVFRQETDRFVTTAAAHLSWTQGGVRVRLASAGHPRAVILRADGGVHFAAGGGLPLGVFAAAPVAVEDFFLGTGDTLLVYSDGVTEARGQGAELYGEQRLADMLARSRGMPAAALVKAIEDDLYKHSAGHTHDDIALLAARVAERGG